MIGKIATSYCCEDLSLIENYNQAVSDDCNWDCHHRFEEMGLSFKDLIELGMYHNRPACELIFLKHSDHISLHQKIYVKNGEGTYFKKGHKMTFTDEHRENISKALIGRKLSAEHIEHSRIGSMKARNNDEYRRKASDAQVLRYSNEEERIAQSIRIKSWWANPNNRELKKKQAKEVMDKIRNEFGLYKASGGALKWNAWRKESANDRLRGNS